ncbi:rubrerythrin [candidate division KSB1 bacterium]|nr:rubrerythrin [candidate division KSB1 bacterium]
MSITFEDSLKILKTAIEVEDNGLETFLKFARKTKDETGKNIFIQLALDEHNHRLILEKQLNKLMSGKKWEPVEIPKSAIEKLSPAVREKQKRTRGESGLAEVDALNVALDLERKTAKFFREQAENIGEPEAKNLFYRLAEWEDSHFDIIQAELDSINNTGFWFDIPEFRMDGKF